MDGPKLVRQSASFIMKRAKYVKINQQKLDSFVESLACEKRKIFPKREDGFHYWVHEAKKERKRAKSMSDEQRALFVLVLTTLNFCFWGMDKIDYNAFQKNLRIVFESGKSPAFEIDKIPKMDVEEFRRLLFNNLEKVPLIDERLRVLKEMAVVLQKEFDGCVSKLIVRAKKDAVALVDMLTSHLRSFRDEAIYDGHQIFFYKRAQIFVADLRNEFGECGFGEFENIDQLTMFADYRVPQVLHHFGILDYAAGLTEKIKAGIYIDSGSREEMEIRAGSIDVVERIKCNLLEKFNIRCASHQIDWYLWEKGQELKQLPEVLPEHRTLTIYY